MKAWEHFKTITTHKLLVMKYCFRIGLYRQGLCHDLSKYSWTEFRVGIRYYQGNRSPNNAEREDTGLSTSWLHHKGRNKHHFESAAATTRETGVPTRRSGKPRAIPLPGSTIRAETNIILNTGSTTEFSLTG